MLKDVKESWINDILMELSEEYEVPAQGFALECSKIRCLDHEILKKAMELGRNTNTLDADSKLSLMINMLSDDGLAVYLKNGVIYFEYKKCICPDTEISKENHEFACECVRLFTKEIIKAVYADSAEIKLLKTIMLDEHGCLIAVRLSE